MFAPKPAGDEGACEGAGLKAFTRHDDQKIHPKPQDEPSDSWGMPGYIHCSMPHRDRMSFSVVAT